MIRFIFFIFIIAAILLVLYRWLVVIFKKLKKVENKKLKEFDDYVDSLGDKSWKK